MSQSMEVRWIIAGHLPEPVQHWFQHLPGVATPPETREDWYLNLSARQDLGIKLRQGRLEIKQRQRPSGLQSLAWAAGQVEIWEKWGFELNSQEARLYWAHPQDLAGQWIRVQKARQLQLYTISAKYGVTAASPETTVPQGCEVEITEIEAFSQPWYSIGFEAFGTGEVSSTDLLYQVATQLLSLQQMPFLTHDYSYSYPGWLADNLGSP